MGIPIVQASALALFMESFLYGIFLMLFLLMSLSIRREISKKKQWPSRVQQAIFFTASVMLALSTAHLIIDIIRACQGFPAKRQRPDSFFLARVNNGLFYAKMSLWLLQTCVALTIQMWRCWIIFKRKWFPIVPLLFGALVYLAGTTMIIYDFTVENSWTTVFEGRVRDWLIIHFVATLYINTLAAGALAWRLIKKSTANAKALGKGPVPISALIMDTVALFSVAYLTSFVLYLVRSNGFFVIADSTMPLAGISFTLLIIRIRLFAMLSINDWTTVPPSGSWPTPPPQPTWAPQAAFGLDSPELYAQTRTYKHGYGSQSEPSTASSLSRESTRKGKTPQIHIDLSQMSALGMGGEERLVREIRPSSPELPMQAPPVRLSILDMRPGDFEFPRAVPPAILLPSDVRVSRALSDIHESQTRSSQAQTPGSRATRSVPGPHAM